MYFVRTQGSAKVEKPPVKIDAFAELDRHFFPRGKETTLTTTAQPFYAH